MKKITITTITSMLLLTTLVGCSSNKIECENAIETQSESIIKDNETRKGYKIEEKEYINKDIKVKYPQISGLEDEKKQELINNLIKTKAISIYNETLKDLEKGQTYEVDSTYEIKLNDGKILSIAYTSYNNITPSAYPYNLFYTTNIDINTGKELKAKDIISNIDGEFIKVLKKGKYVGTVEKDYQEQLMKFVYSNYPSDEELISAVKNSYVYVTKDTVGISILVPHVAGDYVTIEINKNDLKK